MKSFIRLNDGQHMPVRALKKFSCRGETWIVHRDPQDDRKRTFVITHQLTGVRALSIPSFESAGSITTALDIAIVKLGRIADDRFDAAIKKAKEALHA